MNTLVLVLLGTLAAHAQTLNLGNGGLIGSQPTGTLYAPNVMDCNFYYQAYTVDLTQPVTGLSWTDAAAIELGNVQGLSLYSSLQEESTYSDGTYGGYNVYRPAGTMLGTNTTPFGGLTTTTITGNQAFVDMLNANLGQSVTFYAFADSNAGRLESGTVSLSINTTDAVAAPEPDSVALLCLGLFFICVTFAARDK